MTTNNINEKHKIWVKAWIKAGPELEKVRLMELKSIDTQRSILAFSELFDSTIKKFPPRKNSGLIDFQKYLHKSRTI